MKHILIFTGASKGLNIHVNMGKTILSISPLLQLNLIYIKAQAIGRNNRFQSIKNSVIPILRNIGFNKIKSMFSISLACTFHYAH